MKATSIQIGRSYEITFGKSISKVKVKNFDPKHGSWICETESGKAMSIKDSKRFLKEIKPKEPSVVKKTKESKEPKRSNESNESKIPKQKFVDQSKERENKTVPVKTLPKKPSPLNGDLAAKLLATARSATIRANIAKRAFEYGFCSEKIVQNAEREAESARTDVRNAGITERKGGRMIGAMSGLDAAYRVLQEEGRPMRVKEILKLALEKGYCELRGRTPDATVSAAMETEMKRKGKDSRFIKVDKGLFAVAES
ncbi:MAG: winged helix-turn-helix domain-containing protein [Planctomycetaceae bacterium]|jgi:hypothetical protein|nr:winged helix-turn-helix domain-containing protein [Planctomycetaceae bacterium]